MRRRRSFRPGSTSWRSHPEAAFDSPAYKGFRSLLDSLRGTYGYLAGDVNWSGLLNIALDLRGQQFFMDMVDRPEEASRFLAGIAEVVERFAGELAQATGTTSISVNRNVRNLPRPVFLHSECSHVMISVADYERFLMPLDAAWSQRHRPFGIHYCGADPHRYAEAFATIAAPRFPRRRLARRRGQASPAPAAHVPQHPL